MARVQPLAQQFRIARQRTAEATHRLVVRTAKAEHQRIMQTAPRPLTFRRYVDGAIGAPEEAVRANGVILYEYPRLDIVAAFALETLRQRSPVASGLYRDSHTLFLNGAAVADLEAWVPGADVAISNPVPYARKIELGVMTMRVPGHVYETTAQIVRARFGNVATVRFTYRTLAGAAVGKSRTENAQLRFPALAIREAGA